MKIRQLKHHTKNFLIPPIVQFGPPRTGSTLLWNILRTVCLSQNVEKSHSLSVFQKSIFCKSQIVVSIRNPIDSISSSIQRFETTPTIEIIENQLDMFEQNGIWDVISIKNRPKVLILKYEKFAHDWTYMFSELERFLELTIKEETKEACIAEYNIDSVEKKARSLGAFANYDKVNHIHGKHISKFRGAVGYGKNYLNKQMIDRIYERFEIFFKEFGYDYPNKENLNRNVIVDPPSYSSWNMGTTKAVRLT